MDFDLAVSGLMAFLGAFLGMRTFVVPKVQALSRKVAQLHTRCELQHGRFPCDD